MADEPREVRWISQTDATWSTASAWEGGVVPGVGDKVIFNDAATGACTIDVDVTVASFVNMQTSLAGVVIPADRILNVGKEGVGEFIWRPATAFGNFVVTINFYGSSFYAANDLRRCVLYLATDCDLRINVALNNCNIAAAATATFRPAWDSGSPYAAYPLLNYLNFNGGVCTVDGTLDLTNANRLAIDFVSIRPEFIVNGTIRNTNPSRTVPLNLLKMTGVNIANMSGLFTMSLCLRKNVSVDFINFLEGKLHFLESLTVINDTSGYGDVDTVRSNGGTTLPTTIFNLNVSWTWQTTDGSTVTAYGDLTSIAGAITSDEVKLQLSGSTDQTISLAGSEIAYGLSAQKAAGNVTILSGNFSMTSNSDFGGTIDWSRFTGGFRSNGYSIQCDGWRTGATLITGTIDATGSTITNNGVYDGRGVNSSLFTTTRTDLIQQGGTRTFPNSFSVLTGVTGAVFQKITFAEGSFTTIERASFTCNVDVLGVITGAIGRIWVRDNKTLYIGGNGGIEGASSNAYIRVFVSTISGNTKSLRNVYVLLEPTGTIADNCEFHVPIRAGRVDPAGSPISSIGTGCRFYDSVTFDGITSFTLNIGDDCRFFGDIKYQSTDILSINGNLLLAGSADQTIDCDTATNIVQLVNSKNSGSLYFKAGSFSNESDGTFKATDTVFEDRYEGNFNFNRKALSIRSFIVKFELQGVVDVRGCTIYYYGKKEIDATSRDNVLEDEFTQWIFIGPDYKEQEQVLEQILANT